MAATIYDRLRCRLRYEVPIGDGLVNVTEGEQIFRIKKQVMRATLDPNAYHNLITQSAQKRAGLIAHEVPQHTASPETNEPITVRYCANVPIEIEDGPILPGIFLVVAGPLADGVDLTIAKPWIMGIQNRYKGYRFSEPSYSPTRRDDVLLPYETDLTRPPSEASSMESLVDLNSFATSEFEGRNLPEEESGNASESDSSWVEIARKPQKRQITEQAKGQGAIQDATQMTMQNPSETRVPPAILGGSLARTL